MPICVEAKVPENEHQQFRERLVAATRKSDCWRCHKKMDPLGSLEQFTYGHSSEPRSGDRWIPGSDHVCRWKHRNRASEVPGRNDASLGNSEHVEQVFVRHVFRFFMGRNETLGDAATLQQAHAAYRDNDGSFEALRYASFPQILFCSDM